MASSQNAFSLPLQDNALLEEFAVRSFSVYSADSCTPVAQVSCGESENFRPISKQICTNSLNVIAGLPLGKQCILNVSCLDYPEIQRFKVFCTSITSREVGVSTISRSCERSRDIVLKQTMLYLTGCSPGNRHWDI